MGDNIEMNQEIQECCEQIFENINSNFELEEFICLFQDQLYIEMFKIMFPFMEGSITNIEQNQSDTPAERLQQLIDLLSSDILTMDLSHIRGEAISNGDQKHLLNFLQIILELSKLYKMKNKEEEDIETQENEDDTMKIRSTPISPNTRSDQNNQQEEYDDDEKRRHSVLGIKSEFENNEGMEGDQPQDQDQDMEQDPNLHQQDQFYQPDQNQEQQQYDNQDQGITPDGQYIDQDQNNLQQQDPNEDKNGFYDKDGVFHEVEIDEEGNPILTPEQEMKIQELQELEQMGEQQQQDGQEDQFNQQPVDGYVDENGQIMYDENGQPIQGQFDGNEQEQMQQNPDQYNIETLDPQQQNIQQSSAQKSSKSQSQQKSNTSYNNQQQQQIDQQGQQIQEEEDTEEDNQYPVTKELPRQYSKKQLTNEQIPPEIQKQQLEQELFQQQQMPRQLKPNTKKKGGKKKKKKGVLKNNFVNQQKQQIQYPQQQYQDEYQQNQDQQQYYQDQQLQQDQEQQQQGQDQEQFMGQEQYDFDQLNLDQLRDLEQEILSREDIPQDDPQIIEYLQAIQQRQIELQQQMADGYVDLNNLNMNGIIKEQMKNVKDTLHNMRQNRLSENDKSTTEKLMRQKKQYKNFLQTYLKEYDQKARLKERQKAQNQKNQKKKMVQIKIEGINLKKEYENEQKSLYYKLRDEKINYLRKIHRIIFELEKRKIIDEKKEYKNNREKRNQDTRNVLDSIENAYKDRIDMLKDNLQQKRKERKVAKVAQRDFVSKIERELKNEKKKQIDELRDMWRQEKQKFDAMMKDDVQLEQQIMELYKKY